MLIHDPPKSRTRKELKVNLTARQHQSLRLVQKHTGLETPALVAQALDLYFARLSQAAQAELAAR